MHILERCLACAFAKPTARQVRGRQATRLSSPNSCSTTGSQTDRRREALKRPKPRVSLRALGMD